MSDNYKQNNIVRTLKLYFLNTSIIDKRIYNETCILMYNEITKIFINEWVKQKFITYEATSNIQQIYYNMKITEKGLAHIEMLDL